MKPKPNLSPKKSGPTHLYPEDNGVNIAGFQSPVNYKRRQSFDDSLGSWWRGLNAIYIHILFLPTRITAAAIEVYFQ
jgi:hypothetical protein